MNALRAVLWLAAWLWAAPLAAEVAGAGASASAEAALPDVAAQTLAGPDALARPASAPRPEAFPTPMVAPLARIMTALFVICAAGAGLTWWARRRRGVDAGGDWRVKVVASRSLGPRHQAVIVEAGGRRLLLGTGPEGVRTLADLTEPEDFAATLESELPERAHGRPELLSDLEPLGALDA